MGNLPGMAFRCRNDDFWTMEFLSEGCEAITGYHAAELMENRTIAYAALVHPDDIASIKSEIQQSIVAKRRYQLEYRLRTRAGHEKWVWEQGIALYGEDGIVEALEGFITDITRRKRFEEQYRQIFEAVTDGLLIFNRHGRIVAANPAACAMYGYDEKELIGLSGSDIIHPDYRRSFEQFGEVLASGGSFHVESVDVRKDGSSFDVDVRGRTVQFQGELHMLSVVRDVSEKNRAENVLRESEERYRCLIENINAGITLLDRNHRIVTLNPTGAKIIGKTVEECIGHECFRVFKNRPTVCENCPGVLAIDTGCPMEKESKGCAGGRHRLFPPGTGLPRIGQ